MINELRVPPLSIDEIEPDLWYPAYELQNIREYRSAYKSKTTLYNQMTTGMLPAVRLQGGSRRWIVKGEDFLDFILGDGWRGNGKQNGQETRKESREEETETKE